MKHNTRSRFLSVLAFLVLFLCFMPSAYSHPGDTDSNGGHYVKDTGEYHYHHGYPAHQHSDLDGDGNLDCPYDFKDNTSDSSSQSSAFSPEFMERVHRLREQQEMTFLDHVFLVLLSCAFIVLCSVLFNLGEFIDYIKSLFNKNP